MVWATANGTVLTMAPTKPSGFFKDEDCPSSNELLDYQTGDVLPAIDDDIRNHLESCEFCSAELEFYSHYPQEEGFSEVAEIPAPLFELAEALLRNRSADTRSLNALFRESEELAIDGVM